MATKRRTSDEYAEMAADYAANPPTADEVTSLEVDPAVLRTGRPAKGASTTGRTPVMALRLPTELRDEIRQRVDAGETSSESEFIRRAVVEYLGSHPVHF